MQNYEHFIKDRTPLFALLNDIQEIIESLTKDPEKPFTSDQLLDLPLLKQEPLKTIILADCQGYADTLALSIQEWEKSYTELNAKFDQAFNNIIIYKYDKYTDGFIRIANELVELRKDATAEQKQEFDRQLESINPYIDQLELVRNDAVKWKEQVLLAQPETMFAEMGRTFKGYEKALNALKHPKEKKSQQFTFSTTATAFQPCGTEAMKTVVNSSSPQRSPRGKV